MLAPPGSSKHLLVFRALPVQYRTLCSDPEHTGQREGREGRKGRGGEGRGGAEGGGGGGERELLKSMFCV